MKKKTKWMIGILIVFAFSCTVGYRTLMFTNEVAIHQMRGESDNKVFISADGHSEAVYGANKQLINNPYNKGSYNYCHPMDEPACHFIKDMLPWLVLGNDRDDPTSFGERLSAYAVDLKNGFLRSIGV